MRVGYSNIRMPSRKIHNRFAVACGIEPTLANLVNAEIDKPARRLGPNHRRERHDPGYAAFLAWKYNDPNAGLAALLHYELDRVATQNPEFRRWLKVLDAIS